VSAAIPVKRVSFDEVERTPGSIAKVPEDAAMYRIGARWIVNFGTVGTIRDKHTVTEHDDGSVSVEPSLVMPSFDDEHPGFHGWLRHGVMTGDFPDLAVEEPK
jgi:hypothetical protein